jgi:uncharacterized spore protein YtfJ
MTTDVLDRAKQDVLADIRGTRDALTVRRVFGDPYEIDGVTVIPVGRVYGGGGGGAGEGDGAGQTGSGYGTGFGLGAHAIGVYEVRDGEVSWRPAVDTTRLVRNAMALAGLIAVCITCAVRRRHR